MLNTPNSAPFDIKTIFGGNDRSNIAVKENSVIDSDWINSRFFVAKTDLDPDVAAIRYGSVAELKFVDTSMGGNVFINPRPQFNALTDPKADNRVMKYATPTLDPNITANTGIGEGYSEMIDDNQQVVFLEFGLYKFNSLLDFFTRAVDYEDSVLANTGRPSRFYSIGGTIANIVLLVAFPILAITIWTIKTATSALFGDSSLKFYYFRPQMHMYWGIVSTIVTQLVTELGLLVPLMTPASNTKTASGGTKVPTLEQVGVPMKVSNDDIEFLNSLIPGIIEPGTNYIDVYAMVTRAQKAAMVANAAIYKRINDGSFTKKGALDLANYPKLGIMGTIDHYTTFSTYLNDIKTMGNDKSRGDAASTPQPPGPQPTDPNKKFMKDPDTGGYQFKKTAETTENIRAHVDTFSASIRQGGAYAVFAVDYTGGVSESFSNTTTTISLGDKIKAMSNKSRALSYDLARGNFTGSGIIDDAKKGVTDLLKGALHSVSFGLDNVLAAISGNAYVEVPKRWQDSSMSLPTHTYSMQLRAPYNTFVSKLQNEYIPLCMLIAGIVPLSTGKSSYTSPMLCTLFSKGVEIIRMGILGNLSISRGTGNLAFDKKRHALGIDISFKVIDFSTLVTSPVNSTIFGDLFNTTMEDDTPMGNYMAVLGSRDLLTDKYKVKQTGMRISRRIMKLSKAFDTDRLSFLEGDYLNSSLGIFTSSRALPASMINK